jgi:hypothetical protein
MTAGKPAADRTIPAHALSSGPVAVASFDEWRSAARSLIVRRIPPEYVEWVLQDGGGDLLSAMPPMAVGALVNDSEVEVAGEVEVDVAGEVEVASEVVVEVEVAGEVASEVEVEVAGEVEVEVVTEANESVGVSASKLANEETHNPDERSAPPPT